MKLFQDKNFLSALAVNAKYISVVMIGQVGLGLLLALMFRFWLKRCKTIVRTLVFFPVVLPTVAVIKVDKIHFFLIGVCKDL